MQKEAASLRQQLGEAQVKLEEQDEQVRTTTERLAEEVEKRVTAQQEHARVAEALSSALEDCNKMKVELDDATAALTEQSDQAEYLRKLREEVADTIARYQEVTDENQRLRWELLRCVSFIKRKVLFLCQKLCVLETATKIEAELQDEG
jgi:chromosome segregation ATPase